ncbi:hypothetical protein [Bacillus sp. 2205SS5-2]|uniref:hypothetical protein n=1 Tax=Bacillus sp. 2205SS5-2 TaxID=3109031 RepID=UPI00300793FD
MINLNCSEMMRTEETARRWGYKSDSTIRRSINEFPTGTARNFGRSWVVIT